MVVEDMLEGACRVVGKFKRVTHPGSPWMYRQALQHAGSAESRILCHASSYLQGESVPVADKDPGLIMAKRLNRDLLNLWNVLPAVEKPATLIAIPEEAQMCVQGYLNTVNLSETLVGSE